MPKQCSVAICRESRQDRSYHLFPRDPVLRNIWVEACHRKDNFNPERSIVCSNHFLPSDYEHHLMNELLQKQSKKILKKGAVPTQNLLPDIDDIEKMKRAVEAQKSEVLQNLNGSIQDRIVVRINPGDLFPQSDADNPVEHSRKNTVIEDPLYVGEDSIEFLQNRVESLEGKANELRMLLKTCKEKLDKERNLKKELKNEISKLKRSENEIVVKLKSSESENLLLKQENKQQEELIKSLQEQIYKLSDETTTRRKIAKQDNDS